MGSDGPAAYQKYRGYFTKSPLLDIGCMFGYVEYVPDGTEYVGIDTLIYDVAEDAEIPGRGKTTVQLRAEWRDKERSRPGTSFHVADFLDFVPMRHWGMIVAFEVLEHHVDCLKHAQWLKERCDRLLISVPEKEGPAGAGHNGHKLSGLMTADFPDFQCVGHDFGRMFLLWDRP